MTDLILMAMQQQSITLQIHSSGLPNCRAVTLVQLYRFEVAIRPRYTAVVYNVVQHASRWRCCAADTPVLQKALLHMFSCQHHLTPTRLCDRLEPNPRFALARSRVLLLHPPFHLRVRNTSTRPLTGNSALRGRHQCMVLTHTQKTNGSQVQNV
jgi:hypothetical protein